MFNKIFLNFKSIQTQNILFRIHFYRIQLFRIFQWAKLSILN